MRLLTGAGTPREFRVGVRVQLFAILTPDGELFIILLVAAGNQSAALAVSVEPDPYS
jgi:hypothetical protein